MAVPRVATSHAERGELEGARDPPPQHPSSSSAHHQVHRDPAEEQVNEFYQVRVMRWRGGWAARVPTPSLYTSLTPAARGPIILWQVGPWRRGAARHRMLMKLLQLATRQRAVLGTTLLDSHDSFGYMHPEMGLSGNVHASA